MSPVVAEYWGVLGKGLMTTLWISWLALILGGLIGAIVGTARTSPWPRHIHVHGAPQIPVPDSPFPVPTPSHMPTSHP